MCSHNLCLNCFGLHFVRECRSQKTCQVCGAKHHTMLHDANSKGSESNPVSSGNESKVGTLQPQRPLGSTIEASNENISSHNVKAQESSFQTSILLATALVSVSTTHGHQLVARALLNQGSEVSFVSVSCPKTETPAILSVGNYHWHRCTVSRYILRPSRDRPFISVGFKC